MRALALILLSAGPVLAETPMTGAEFEAYVTGKTLYFAREGRTYGAEQYLPGRRVVWSFLDGRCEYGDWHEQGSQICFTYETRPDESQCWSFFAQGGGLSARYETQPGRQPLFEVQQNAEPLYCPGPDVGV